MNVINQIQAELEKVKDDLIRHYDEKGMRASGRFANSLEIIINSQSGYILAEDYSEQLELGREATTNGGNGTLRERISQWVDDKGITADNISKSSLVFLITRKIHREGWNRQGYGGVNLISEVLTDSRMREIEKNISGAIYTEFAEFMNKFQTV